ncbi:hypothetical protein FOZ63_001062 [Perkinsus olseni]|uniref:HAD family hydrolase n=1 Tax=Perkinsus olseni TaxID=32597 RepID=A0A7J6TZP5_PEROL|nr:hypothetical protein FOZ60_012562 [Perkinsus olseni]KAF4707963.1 hypothetical protein FOZ62_016099 [Perkinsus olseni]KAF4750102.1 hypothetical protein FOZ63_001062 [Perkinsus olseni]
MVNRVPRYLIFDKDGTLLDLNKTYGASVEVLAKRMSDEFGVEPRRLENVLGLDPERKRFKEDALCMTVSNSEMARKVEDSGIPAGPVMSHMKDYRPTFVPACNLPVLFGDLRELGVQKIGVLSLDDVAATERFLEAQGLSSSDVDGIVGGDMNLRPKPSDDGVKFLLKKWKCGDLREAMIVGDHPMDMKVGAGFGWRVGVCGTGLSSPEALWAAGATHVIRDVSKLIDCVIKENP